MLLTIKAGGAYIAILFFAIVAHAQDIPRMPTDEELKKVEMPTLEGAQQGWAKNLPRMPTDEELKQIELPTLPSEQQIKAFELPAFPTHEQLRQTPGFAMPKIDPLPHFQQSINIEELAKNYERLVPEVAGLHQGNLMILVSFGMPDIAIKALIDQARRSGATLVLRGLVNDSMEDTATKMLEVMGRQGVKWHIDPTVFQQFKVTEAPAFLLTEPRFDLREAIQCIYSQQCQQQLPDYAIVAGNVTLEYALEYITKHKPSLEASASYFLNRLRGETRSKEGARK